ncbi:MAG: class I SAM-dependent methyltransferase [Actinomycetota bacterium]
MTRPKLRYLERRWNRLGREDPLWAVYSDPEKRGSRWDIDAFLETGVTEITHMLEEARACGLDPRGRALDFGCGVGRLTQALAAHFDEVWGVDVAPSMIEEAERINRFPDRVHYRLNTVDDLSTFEDDRFGLVYSSITLQHIEPGFARRYIAEFYRVTKPGGAVIFAIPEPTPRQWIKEKIPRGLVRAGLSALSLIRPRMESWGMSPGDVSTIVSASGGRVLRSGGDAAFTTYYTIVGDQTR